MVAEVVVVVAASVEVEVVVVAAVDSVEVEVAVVAEAVVVDSVAAEDVATDIEKINKNLFFFLPVVLPFFVWQFESLLLLLFSIRYIHETNNIKLKKVHKKYVNNYVLIFNVELVLIK